ncbi:MAG TPA: uL15m family ribosomal protein, partial [Thermoplasmata archaeon]|nr:uL15m family ribosomal protein [Thermoplasmata archaeon]
IRHHHGLGKTLSINVEDVELRLDALVAQGFAAEAGEGYAVDLGKAGFQKLLGGGRTTVPLQITVPAATEAARAKVEAAGGAVTVTETAE